MTKISSTEGYVVFNRKFPQICIRGNLSIKGRLAVLLTLANGKSPMHSLMLGK